MFSETKDHLSHLSHMEKIGFGGSCHWCTEAIFQSLIGVTQVLQGWIAADDAPEQYSEAVIVSFDASKIPLHTLIEIHLHTHSCTSLHSMRQKYRSAVYCFSADQLNTARGSLKKLQEDFIDPIITEALIFSNFMLNRPEYLNYYYSDKNKPFCKNIIEPKLKTLLRRFRKSVVEEKLSHNFE